MAPDEPQPPPHHPHDIELGPNIGVPMGAKAIRPNATMDTPITDAERAAFAAMLGPAEALKIPAPPASPTALVADDDPQMREYFKAVLQNMKVAAVDAREGQQVLKIVATTGLSFVVLDLRLPGGVDGFGVLRGIRTYLRRADLPVCVISGSSDPRDEATALRLGADDYIVKPSDYARLSARFSLLLKRSPR